MLRSVLGASYFWKLAIEGPSIQTVATQLAGTGLRLLQEGSSNTKLLAFEGLESATSISSPALIASGPNPPHRVWVKGLGSIGGSQTKAIISEKYPVLGKEGRNGSLQ